MHCDLCNKNTQCMCRGGGCKGCGQTNPQVEYTNKLLKFGMDKDKVFSNMQYIHTAQKVKVDAYLIFNKLQNGIELEEKFIEAIENGKALVPERKKVVVLQEEEDCGKIGDNPNEQCVFEGKSPWDVCIYCCSIKRYMKGKQCERFIGNKQG